MDDTDLQSTLKCFTYRIGVDVQKDVVLCEVPFGGVLFINNMIPHRRYDLFTFCKNYSCVQ